MTSTDVFMRYLEQFAGEPEPSSQHDPWGGRAAVIVESRDLPWLSLVQRNFRHFLGNDWNYYVIRPESLSILEYNALLRTEAFWAQFHEEHILVYQSDTVAFRPLDDRFLDYDMIGALCGAPPIYCGGLSLRKRSAMLAVIENCGSSNLPEDIYFTNGCAALDLRLPHCSDAAAFAVESLPKVGGLPFGMHGSRKEWLSERYALQLVTEALAGRTPSNSSQRPLPLATSISTGWASIS